jgi:putative flippase GtrA
MQIPAWAKRVGPYTLVSTIVTASDYTVFFFLIRALTVEPLIANLCSWAVAVAVAYGLHSAFTFDVKISLHNFARYVAVCLSTLILGTALLAIFTAFVPTLTAKVASTILVFTASFALSQLTVFRTA